MSSVIYGPVPSWRLGKSLGIDLLSTKGKTCCFDCVYCQLGRTLHLLTERRQFVPGEGDQSFNIKWESKARQSHLFFSTDKDSLVGRITSFITRLGLTPQSYSAGSTLPEHVSRQA